MNKKQMSLLLDQLATRLEQASSDNKALELENKELREKSEALSGKAATLENEIAALKAELEALKEEKNAQAENAPEAAEQHTGNIPSESPLSPLQNLEQKVANQVRLSDETEYAASVIGKIVVSATRHCNYLTATGNPNAKELVNLILGKTEVLKAEILNIVYSPADFITKKALIDNQLDTAKDYFTSVKAQI